MRTILIVSLLVLASMDIPARAADEHPHAHEDAPQLSLDAGRKWEADRHTADSVAAMRSAVRTAPANTAQASIDDLHAAGRQLREQLQALIRGCTMTGKAHDQLHAWIGQLAPEIEKLSSAGQVDAARASLDRISGLLATFDAHFEPAAL